MVLTYNTYDPAAGSRSAQSASFDFCVSANNKMFSVNNEILRFSEVSIQVKKVLKSVIHDQNELREGSSSSVEQVVTSHRTHRADTTKHQPAHCDWI